MTARPARLAGDVASAATRHGGSGGHGALAGLSAEAAVLVEAIAQRTAALVAERLSAEAADRGQGLVDARRVAEVLGVSVEYVRDHADELGVKRGPGVRPRLRFDLDEVLERLAACSEGKRAQALDPAPEREASRRRRRTASSGATSVPLLPVRGRRAA